MRVMWSTPLLRLNLLDAAPPEALPRVRALLSSALQAILAAHAEVAAAYAENITDSDPSSPNGLNAVFFRWQTTADSDGWRAMFAAHPDVLAQLERFWQSAVDLFLHGIGQPPRFLAERSREMHPWATVHAECCWHDLHSHPGQLVSGVFYLSVPEGAGKITFYDPRGPLPPFDDTYQILPREGDLLIFPSWLPHLVTSSRTDPSSPRVSVAFNIPGAWHDTSAVATEFQVID